MAIGRFRKKRHEKHAWRMRVLRLFFFAFAAVILFRLFSLQVINAGFYEALASGQHSFYQELVADRGDLYVREWKSDAQYMAATNEPRAFIFADPRKIEDPETTARALAEVLGYEIVEIVEEPEAEVAGEELEFEDIETIDDAVAEALKGAVDANGELVEQEEQIASSGEAGPGFAGEGLEELAADDEEEAGKDYLQLIERLSKEDDPYEPVARNIDEDTLEKILALELPGIDYILENVRSYPEKNLGGHLIGFVGMDADGKRSGRYGLEGYFDQFLAGKNGFLDTETDLAGRWIGVGTRHFEPAVDGGDVVLTIDRTVQYVACKMLREGVERHQADGGSLVILEPSSGKVLAMCNAPDFDPNAYNEVNDISIYNNQAIFTAYEPGSVFKPIVMAGALIAKKVSESGTILPVDSEP
ncbi:hypothetical protein IH979_03675, partial [Patescibacteria group bacterium]|nr:hypothetical protein [Patescibacteria group bacterium]